jgi:hypothetical protein
MLLPDGLELAMPPMLQPKEVMQVAFLVEQQTDDPESAKLEKELEVERRAVLGQLNIEWAGVMGEMGKLSTGWLATKRR